MSLKYPYKWEERRPEILNRVLFVPSYYEKHQEWNFPAWEDPQLFGKKGKVVLEYCSGNGSWIIEKASLFPENHFVAIERKFERVKKIFSKLHKGGLSNLIIVCGEALTFTSHYLPAHSVDEIYINFPDPWPKLKHAKHRLIQSPFTSQLLRVMKGGGKATFVTDHENYSKQMIQEMLNCPGWESTFPSPYYVTEMENYGTSYFDGLWRGKGKTIHYHEFKKKI